MDAEIKDALRALEQRVEDAERETTNSPSISHFVDNPSSHPPERVNKSETQLGIV